MASRYFLKILLLLSCGTAIAQPYPGKPVRVIVPYVAGGSADITARTIAQKLSESLGNAFVVENRAGANGSIGTDVVAKAAPDGYTLLLVASGPVVVNPSLYSKVPYDPVKDLQPVTQVTTYQYVLVVPAASSFKTISDLIKNAKEKPGQLSYGSTGIGGGNHLAGELLALTTGTQLNHIPYKGSAPALADLLGGQLSFMFDTVVTSVPQIRGGKLRAFAVSGPARAAVLPDVPTLQELGYKGFEITQWQGFFAPAGTDRAIVAKLREEGAKTLAQKDVVERLVTQGGNEIVGNTPEQFARVVEADLARYARLIRDAKIRAE